MHFFLENHDCEDGSHEQEAYNDFVTELFNLYNETTNHRELISILLYTDVELSERVEASPNDRYIAKAAALVQRLLKNIRLEIRYTSDSDGRKRRIKSTFRWTESDVDFVELVYALVESGSIDYGSAHMKDVITDLGAFLGINIKDGKNSYSSSIKRRKTDSRTHFLDRLAYALNKKMDIEDKLDPPTPPENYDRTLFD